MEPLAGIRVLELAGLGPAPFCAMLLADLGADVIRIDRPPSAVSFLGMDRVTCRNKRSLALDLKHPAGRDLLLQLVATADILIEGLRPGVVERLGVGPDECREVNDGLIYGRMTGWGQDGPLAENAGHDINYVAITGALDAIGPRGGGPVPPLSLVGDMGGGALYLAMGLLAALVARENSGRGQVVDAAVVDGTLSLMTTFFEFRGLGVWEGSRGTNLLDGGCPFYRTYRTADGAYMAVGALEPHFYEQFITRLGIDRSGLPKQYDTAGWSELERRFSEEFLTKSREEWAAVFAGSDACVTPVLTMAEVAEYPPNKDRATFVEVGDSVQPAPAPRFSDWSHPARSAPAPEIGEHNTEILRELGLDAAAISALIADGAVL